MALGHYVVNDLLHLIYLRFPNGHSCERMYNAKELDCFNVDIAPVHLIS